MASLARSGPLTGAMVCNWTTREPSRAEFCDSTRQYGPCCRGGQATGPLMKLLQQRRGQGMVPLGGRFRVETVCSNVFCTRQMRLARSCAIGLQHSILSAEYRDEVILALQS